MPLGFLVLGELVIQVLLVHGMQDVTIPATRTNELQGFMPTDDTHIVNQRDHCSQVERANEFN